MQQIASRLAAVNLAAIGITAKRLANVRSDFLAAVRQSGLRPLPQAPRTDFSPEWLTFFGVANVKRYRLGLARLARHASSAGLGPAGVDDALLTAFMDEVRRGSLHQNPNVLHRQIAKIWNEAAEAFLQFGLRTVTQPSFKPAPKRVAWESLSSDFHADVEAYLDWCAVPDPFAENARAKHLQPRTLKLRRNQIHAAVSALMEAGVPAGSIVKLADLVVEANFRKLLRRRHHLAGGKPKNFDRDLAEALIQIGREWAKVEPVLLERLRKITATFPKQPKGMTAKNTKAVRQFDDLEVVDRLLELPDRLWREVKLDPNPSFRTLARAQAALAIRTLTYIPLRSENLHNLMFDTHIFLRDGRRARSTLEVGSEEVKNGETPLAFDIPPQLSTMLTEYRESIAPKVIGRRPDRVFVRADGAPKSQAMVAHLIKTYLRKKAGIVMTPHQFRHLAAKIILRTNPAAYETVRQLLGHKSLRTTNWFYAKEDSRAAGLHHQRLVEAAAARNPSRPRRRAQKRSNAAVEVGE
jgi:integrase